MVPTPRAFWIGCEEALVKVLVAPGGGPQVIVPLDATASGLAQPRPDVRGQVKELLPG
jgi:hypothetical protein